MKVDSNFLWMQNQVRICHLHKLHCKRKEVLLAKGKNQHSTVPYSFPCTYSLAPTLFVDSSILFSLRYHGILVEDQISLEV